MEHVYVSTRHNQKPAVSLHLLELAVAKNEPINFDIYGHESRYVPERTCKIERVEHDELGMYYYTSCGHCTISHSHVPCFCSECGARVVGHERRNMSDKENTCEGCAYEGLPGYCGCDGCARAATDNYRPKVVK